MLSITKKNYFQATKISESNPEIPHWDYNSSLQSSSNVYLHSFQCLSTAQTAKFIDYTIFKTGQAYMVLWTPIYCVNATYHSGQPRNLLNVKGCHISIPYGLALVSNLTLSSVATPKSFLQEKPWLSFALISRIIIINRLSLRRLFAW